MCFKPLRKFCPSWKGFLSPRIRVILYHSNQDKSNQLAFTTTSGRQKLHWLFCLQIFAFSQSQSKCSVSEWMYCFYSVKEIWPPLYFLTICVLFLKEMLVFKEVDEFRGWVSVKLSSLSLHFYHMRAQV